MPPVMRGGLATPTPTLMSVTELENRYLSVWSSIKSEGPGVSPHRELLQLGMPTDTTVSVWHAYADTEAARSVAPSVTTTPPVDLERCIRRFDGQGAPLSAGAVPLGPFRIERIEVACLLPNATLVVKVGDTELTAMTAPAADGKMPAQVSFIAHSCTNPYDNRSGRLEFEAAKINALNLLEARATGRIAITDLPQRPSFAVALGDQIYVDGDNGNRTATTALGLFRGKASLPVFDIGQAAPFLNVVYRYHFGLPPLDAAMRALPTAMVWDDHDIRDGWGSHGDEQRGDMLGYFAVAKKAFAAFQDTRNPHPGPTAPKGLDVSFSWGPGLRFFLVDGRSNRTFGEPTRANSMLSDEQFCAIEKWLGDPESCAKPGGPPAAVPPAGEHDASTVFVLGLPTPLSSDSKPAAEALHICSATNDTPVIGEGADDIRDTWFCNLSDRTRLLRILAKHFAAHKKHRLLIVSGDVHYSGVTFLTLPDGTPIGHEVISSGLANDHIKNPAEVLGTFDGAALEDSEGKTLLLSNARGSLVGTPSFAEIVANYDAPNGAPQLSVVFYPSRASRRTNKDARRDLVNVASALEGRSLKSVPYSFGDSSASGKCSVNPPWSIARVALDLKVPKFKGTQPRNCVHAQSVVCVTPSNSVDAATDWKKVGPNLKCEPPKQ
jgi:hypothetical protein